MTEYGILIITDGFAPVTYQEGGVVEAESKEKAVKKFKESKTMDELADKFDFNGSGNIVDVLAVPNNYVDQYAMNYGSGSADVTKVD